jgi:hypothetical protein
MEREGGVTKSVKFAKWRIDFQKERKTQKMLNLHIANCHSLPPLERIHGCTFKKMTLFVTACPLGSP